MHVLSHFVSEEWQNYDSILFKCRYGLPLWRLALRASSRWDISCQGFISESVRWKILISGILVWGFDVHNHRITLICYIILLLPLL